MADPHPGASPYSLWKSHLSLAGSILAASFLYILLKEKEKKFINTAEKKQTWILKNISYYQHQTLIIPKTFQMFWIYRENLNSVQKKGKLNYNSKPGLYNNASGIRSCKYGILMLYNSEFYHTILFKYRACLYHKSINFFSGKKTKLYSLTFNDQMKSKLLQGRTFTLLSQSKSHSFPQNIH